MPSVNSSQPLQDTPSYGSVRKAKANLRACSCLQTWEELHHLSLEGKRHDMVVLRYRLCIEEQVWARGDIEGIYLSAYTQSDPYPEVVHVCLANKLKNARSNRKEAFEFVCEKRRLLEQKHRLCHSQAKSDLNVLFKVTKA